MKGYVIVDAILLEIAAKRKVSRGVWLLCLAPDLEKLKEFGGKVDLKSSKR